MYESFQVPGVVNGVRNRPLSPSVEVEIFVTASSFEVSGYGTDSKDVPRAGSQPYVTEAASGPIEVARFWTLCTARYGCRHVSDGVGGGVSFSRVCSQTEGRPDRHTHQDIDHHLSAHRWFSA